MQLALRTSRRSRRRGKEEEETSEAAIVKHDNFNVTDSGTLVLKPAFRSKIFCEIHICTTIQKFGLRNVYFDLNFNLIVLIK